MTLHETDESPARQRPTLNHSQAAAACPERLAPVDQPNARRPAAPVSRPTSEPVSPNRRHGRPAAEVRPTGATSGPPHRHHSQRISVGSATCAAVGGFSDRPALSVHRPDCGSTIPDIRQQSWSVQIPCHRFPEGINIGDRSDSGKLRGRQSNHGGSLRRRRLDCGSTCRSTARSPA